MSIPELKDIQRKKEYADHKKSIAQTNIFIAEKYGSFYFLFYKLTTSSNIEKQHIIRFLYLCTYMDYENKLVYGNQVTDRKYMVNGDLQEILKLNKSATIRTKEDLLKNGLMRIDECGHMIINSEYCLKGKIGKGQSKAMKTRIFENAVRELYEKSKPIEHRKLSMLVTILPFINFYNNILCYTPDAEEMYQMRTINLKQLCKITGYTENHIGRLKNDLLSLKVGGESVAAIIEIGKSQTITINPRIYYRASDLEKLEPLYKYFLLE